MYERRHEPLASPAVFRRRMMGAGGAGLALIGISLAVGMAGYMLTERLGVIDAFLNASMILSGMGPVHNPETTAGKIFAGCYAIYSGFAVLGIAAIVFAPVMHRWLHRFHLEERKGRP